MYRLLTKNYIHYILNESTIVVCVSLANTFTFIHQLLLPEILMSEAYEGGMCVLSNKESSI